MRPAPPIKYEAVSTLPQSLSSNKDDVSLLANNFIASAGSDGKIATSDFDTELIVEHPTVIVLTCPAGHACKNGVHFSVTNTGSRLNETDAARVFQPLRRAEAAHERDNGGSGLGLAISCEITEWCAYT